MKKDGFSSKKTFVVNFISNVGFFGTNTIVSLWFVSYLIRHLGVAVYGLIPLAMTITSYFNLVTVGLNAAVGRYMTIALERNDKAEASKIFNSSFWASIFISGILFFFGIGLSLFASRWLNVPLGCEREVSWLFVFTVMAFLITTIGSSFNIISYCRNRFDLQNLGNVSGLILRVLLVVVLFKIFSPRLWEVGAGIVGAAVVTFIVSIWACRYLLPALKVDFKDFHLQTLKGIGQTGVWIFINQLGTILILSIDLLVANKLFGAEQAGRYATVLQWSVFLRNFGIVVAGIFGPSILAYYARNDIDGLVAYSKRAVKFVGLLIGLPVGLICGFSKPLLTIWLGPSFTSLAPLMALMTFHLCLNLGYLPLHTISTATNNVRLPALVQIVLGGANLLLAIWFAKGCGMGLYGIALAGVIILIFKNVLFNPFYSAFILKKDRYIFSKELFPLIILTGFASGLSYCFAQICSINSWLSLALWGGIVSLIYCLFVWKYLLRQEEIHVIKRLVEEMGINFNFLGNRTESI